MKNHQIFAMLLFTALVYLAPRVRADAWHQTTRVTVKEPIRVPGMVLAPGTYTFKLLSPESNIVQIWSAHQMHLYTSIMTVPDQRRNAAEHTMLEFTEGRRGSPPELHAWFYPGETIGQEFVYRPTAATGKA